MNDLDKSMNKIFHLAELLARLETKVYLIKTYNDEIKEILDQIKGLFDVTDDQTNP